MLDLVQTRQENMRRKEASVYLKQMYGIPAEVSTLAKYAVNGGGPKFRKTSSRVVLYSRKDLDEWALARLGEPLTSTSDSTANQ